jgi:putative tryptophan/tyrosine transport system substrate-binding protein
MRRRELLLLVGAAMTTARTLHAQQAGKVFRIGFLTAGAKPLQLATIGDFLRELGWVEGKNFVWESRYADNRLDRLPELAAELVALKVDLIMSSGTLAPLAAKRATATIPIVMAEAGDPVGSGLVESLARPGGNVTGMSLMVPELGGKRLELLKDLLPNMSRVAVLWNAANPYAAAVFKESERAAQTLGMEVQSLEVRGPDDFGGVFEAAKRQPPDALTVVDDPLTVNFRKEVVDFAATCRLPAIYGSGGFVDAGGLMSYGANLNDLWRHAASYVDKILKGARPRDLPVEQPTKFELLVNLKTAKALGLTIPPSILARADEVIE